jgi:hypothetical protein
VRRRQRLLHGEDRGHRIVAEHRLVQLGVELRVPLDRGASLQPDRGQRGAVLVVVLREHEHGVGLLRRQHVAGEQHAVDVDDRGLEPGDEQRAVGVSHVRRAP